MKKSKAQEPEEELDVPEAEIVEDPPSDSSPLEAERDEYKDKWQRAQADYQNLRRRTRTDIEAASKRARQGLLEGVLNVLDSLEMALQSPAESEEAQQLKQGVDLTRAQLLQLLSAEDVEAVPPTGPFDPAVHEAVATVPAGTVDVEPGQIVETVRRGYRWGDGVLRYAQVVVAAQPAEGQEA